MTETQTETTLLTLGTQFRPSFTLNINISSTYRRRYAPLELQNDGAQHFRCCILKPGGCAPSPMSPLPRAQPSTSRDNRSRDAERDKSVAGEREKQTTSISTPQLFSYFKKEKEFLIMQTRSFAQLHTIIFTIYTIIA